MKHTTFLVATATAAMFSTGAMASSVSIDQIDAFWSNVVSGPVGEPADVDNSDPDAVKVSWPGEGTPQEADPSLPANQSSYTFIRAATSFPAAEGVPFSLGTFIHDNQPIPTNSGLVSADLNFSFGGTPEFGSLETFGAIFNFFHDETPNLVGTCPAGEIGVPCDDFVTVGAVGGASEDVQVGNLVYTFTLLGFSPDGTPGSFSNVFRTAENQDNQIQLWAEYTVAPIPLPAAGWLLLGGLGALGVAARRRRNAA